MEVLEEQLEEVATNAAESQLAADNNAAELASLRVGTGGGGGERAPSENGGSGPQKPSGDDEEA